MIHFHKWSLWSVPLPVLSTKRTPEQMVGYAQTRRCRVCGKVKNRTVML